MAIKFRIFHSVCQSENFGNLLSHLFGNGFTIKFAKYLVDLTKYFSKEGKVFTFLWLLEFCCHLFKQNSVKSTFSLLTCIAGTYFYFRPDFDHCARFIPRRNAGTAQVIVSVGGEDDKVVLRSVEYWDPCTNIWKQLACLPFAVRY